MPPVSTAYIAQRAAALGLDPQAVAAVGGREGYSGRIGDGGHAFGPFQLNNAGGVLTGQFAGQSPQQINQWAWSPAGIDYALNRINSVAHGLKGSQAIQSIVRRFERPADPNGEVAGALAAYGKTAAGGPVPTSGVPTSPVVNTGAAGSSPNQALLLSLLGNGGKDQVLTSLLAQHMNQGIDAGASPLGPLAPNATTGHAIKGSSVVQTALSQIGKPYQWGGPAVLGKATDCSGLIQASLGAHGISVGRTTYQQWQQGKPVNSKNLQPGDAVFFNMGKQGPEHVGMYIGGGKFVEDPHTGAVVRTENLASYPGFVGARRYT